MYIIKKKKKLQRWHFPRAHIYLKQLICFELLRTEHDAVSVTSDSDSLAAVTQQHHILTVFTVEPMGNTCYYTHTYTHTKEEERFKQNLVLVITIESGLSRDSDVYLVSGLGSSSQ